MTADVCTIDGCDRYPDGARGWCQIHYRRFRKLGDPLAEYPPRRPSAVVGAGRKLTDDEIRKVRHAYLWSTPVAELADEYGVSKSTIYNALAGGRAYMREVA